MSFQSILKLLTDGVDKVEAGSLNPIFRTLDGNIKYLKEIIESASAGNAIILREQTVESAALVGQPVYWNSTHQEFRKALAAAVTDDDDNLVLGETAQVWGLIYRKTNATKADILVAGKVALDLDNAVDGAITAGVYYLSTVTAGKLVKTVPNITVTVCQADGAGNVLVRPSYKDALENFATVDSVVTSLVSLSDKLVITCATDDSEASVGPLQIDLDLGITLSNADNASGHLAVKTFNSDTGVFTRGPVVDALVAGTNVSLSSTAQSGANHRGVVTVNADLEINGKQLPARLIRLLGGVQEDYYSGVPGLNMESGKLCSYVAAVDVPDSLPGGTQMKLRFWVMAFSAGSMPDLTLGYRKLPNPDTVLSTEEDLVTVDSALTINCTHTATAADKYIRIESNAFAVTAGDMVLFTLTRPSNEGGPDILIIRQEGVLVAS